MGYKILMALNGMDIGGAETHAAELSLELQRRGYEVILASNGGTYVPRLEAAGLRHFQVPMNRRSVQAMVESRKRLSRIIRAEKPDIVHAHARIPGYLCGSLKKSCGFAFVTTCHGVYSSGRMADRMTNWGEHTFAVSEDARGYLIQSFGVPEDHITVTINGIDTNRFAPGAADESAARELGLDCSAPVLLTVSRLDSASSLAAELLLQQSLNMAEAVPGLQLVIVGGGTEFGRLQALAEEQNAAAGRPLIRMTGPRTDVDRILSLCTAFVGVGRSALEAMASAVPIILAGNRGYQGILTPDNLAEAAGRNFGCRNAAPLEGEALCRDVLTLLRTDEEERRNLGAFGRSAVLKDYSVARMADDCEQVYRRFLSGNP